MPDITPMGAQLLFKHLTGTQVWTPAGAYLAIFFTKPFDLATMAVGTEATGGSYARQLISPGAFDANDLAMFNASAVRFDDMPPGEVFGVGIFDDPIAGTLIFYENYATTLIVNAGQRFVVLADTMSVMFT